MKGLRLLLSGALLFGLSSCAGMNWGHQETGKLPPWAEQYRQAGKIPPIPDPAEKFEVDNISQVPLIIGVVDYDYNLLPGYRVRVNTYGTTLRDYQEIEGGLDIFPMGQINEPVYLYLLGRGGVKYPVIHVHTLKQLKPGQKPILFRFGRDGKLIQ